MAKEKEKKGKAEHSQKSEAALREEEVLAFWERSRIFEKSVEKDAPNGEFVFYDGPPFATGLPHYGHILASTIKDAIPRYKTMRGYRVRRTWGWDCHGLPLENLIEKQLGLATKRDIEELGVKQFNEAARAAVMEYADDWKRIIPRMGRWADMEDDYKTMDSAYTESVWWVFKELHEKGLVYEGFKSMYLCPRCGTTLSNFEVNQGYKDIKDIAVTVELPLLDERGEKTDTSLLVWTTTPWTLPGNMAAAVHKDAEYVKARVTWAAETSSPKKGEAYTQARAGYYVILAKEVLENNYEQRTEEGQYLVHDKLLTVEGDPFKGADLVGRSYEPPFAYFKDREFENKENAWKIYHADYVEIGEEGTGAVHLAPAYGEEDMQLAQEHNIPIVHHVGQDGRFLDFITDFAGAPVKPKDGEKGNEHLAADIAITRSLDASGKLFAKENITHSYPHCWRCETPLLNYATTSWFVKVTDIKDALVAENEKVSWVPEYVGTNRFGRWLEGARDWAVSRARYWGAPLPVWRNPETKAYTVFGSLTELQEHVLKSGNRYLMMRHGESHSNEAGVVSADVGNTEDTLTENGRAQVARAAAALTGDVDLIVTSPFARTKESANILARELGLAEECIIEDARLGEVDIAARFEGQTWDDYNALFPTWDDRYTQTVEGIENRRDVQVRAGELLYEIEQMYKDRKILFMGHGGTLFALTCAAHGLAPEHARELHDTEGYLKNAEYTELSFIPMPHNDYYELDLHRPYIDEIELYEGETKLERVPDVFDCWFESGSMPYGQMHYPFEHTDVFDPNERAGYPADFIAEGLDQTRGWFYSLIVLGTALFGQSPYKNVIVNGLILAEDGRKMSKSLQNYPDPMLMVDRYGADTVRFYMLASPVVRGEDLNFSESGLAELSRKNLGRLHNVLNFYELYARADVGSSSESSHALDRWVRARLAAATQEITAGFEAYELDRATRPITDLIDDLSVWYVRRSRDRLKGEDAADRDAALATLRYVLTELAKLMAPTMPFYADYLYRRVVGDTAASVHLAAWPEAGEADTALLENMRRTREIVTAALEARAKANIKVRQPLALLSVKGAELSPELSALIADEVNVKHIIFDTDLPEAVVLDTELTDELKAEGMVREFMRDVQDARKKRGLAPQDRVVLTVSAPESAAATFEQYRNEIERTTTAELVVLTEASEEPYAFTIAAT